MILFLRKHSHLYCQTNIAYLFFCYIFLPLDEVELLSLLRNPPETKKYIQHPDNTVRDIPLIRNFLSIAHRKIPMNL